MKFTAGQEEVIKAVFKECDPEGQGAIPSEQLLEAIRHITNVKVNEGHFKESVGKTPTEVGSVDYNAFVDILARYLQDMRVTQWGLLTTPMEGRVGIDSLPTQVKKKALRHSIQFNIMLVGGSGLGKSTLQNTLFKSLLSSADRRTMSSTVGINSTTHCIEERGTRVMLTIVDTPGFGDQINNTDTWVPVASYIKDQYRAYLEEELKPKRKRVIPDTRVHVVLYFIAPTGHNLKALDVNTMKALGRIANVIPIIAKADALTMEERVEFRQRIMEDIAANRVRVFPFSMDDDEDDDRDLVSELRARMPFAVVGCDNFAEGQLIRRTAWGDIQVENPAHCDLSLLRDLLIRNHMSDLIRVTDKFFYEEFRTASINGVPDEEIALTPPPSPMPTPQQPSEEEEAEEDEYYSEEE